MPYTTYKNTDKKNILIKNLLKNFPIKEKDCRNVGTLPGFASILVYYGHSFIYLILQTKYLEKTLKTIALTFDISLEDYIKIDGIKIPKIIPLLFVKENGYQEISNNKIVLIKMQACNQIDIDVRQKNKKVYKPTKKTYDKFLEFANKKYKKNEIYKNSKFSISDNNDLVYKNDIILLHNLKKCKNIFKNDDDSEGEDEDDNSDKDDEQEKDTSRNIAHKVPLKKSSAKNKEDSNEEDSYDEDSYDEDSYDEDSYDEDSNDEDSNDEDSNDEESNDEDSNDEESSDSDNNSIIIISDSDEDDEPKRKRLRNKY
jgi:hypothetical protein